MTHGAPAPYNTLPEEYEKEKAFQFGSTTLTLPALKINKDTVIYVLNIMGGNPDFVVNYATDLCYALETDKNIDRIKPINGIISVEGKSIPLVYEIAAQSGLSYVILRKSCKPYMGERVLSTKVKSTTTFDEQELYLDNKDLTWIHKHRLVFIDDVISSGATLKATEKIVNMAGGTIVACLAMAIEGDYVPTIPHYSLAKLPVIKLKSDE